MTIINNNNDTYDYTIKINALHDLVSRRTHLTSNQRDQLFTRLMMKIDEFEIAEYMNEKQKEEQVHMNNMFIMMNHMRKLDDVLPGSEEETEIIGNLFSTYVPDVVKKTILETTSEKDILDEADGLEYPHTPNTTREDSPEYHQRKSDALKKIIYDNKNINEEQKKQMYELLLKHADRLSLAGENMERTDTVQHEIETTKPPFRERLRPYSPAVQDIIDAEVMKMLKDGIIVPSKSAYASNLLLVRKPDESSEGGMKNRVCAAFVKLNEQTAKDSYPLPNIHYIFDRIGRSKWFTTMDLLSGFWQVMIKPEHRHKTAFVTMRGLYEFVVMPFGLCNAPATFQRLMDAIVLPEYRSFIETYIDDLMTHSMNFDDHLKHLDTLFTILKQNKLLVKLSKCKFAQLEVKFLGHLISQNSLKTNPEAVAAIAKWQRPVGTGAKAVTALRGFLGMAGWYRKFIPHLSHVAKPLYDLTKKKAAFIWTPECQAAFDTIRDALTCSPVLGIADPNKDYIVHTDASDWALGTMLAQLDENGDEHPIAYASKTLNSAQRNYDTTDREALAIVWALEQFNTYCEGHKYTLLSDHKALSYLKIKIKDYID